MKLIHAPSWMGKDVIAFMQVTERMDEKRGAVMVSQCDLVHVDGTLLYQGVKLGEEKGLSVQVEVSAMGWAINCNAHMLPHLGFVDGHKVFADTPLYYLNDGSPVRDVIGALAEVRHNVTRFKGRCATGAAA